MKKLTKMNINPDKFIKNEELVTLKGGYDGNGCCDCYEHDGSECLGYMGNTTKDNCSSTCNDVYKGTSFGSWGC